MANRCLSWGLQVFNSRKLRFFHLLFAAMSIFITVAICRFEPSANASMFVLHCSFPSKLLLFPPGGSSVCSSFSLFKIVYVFFFFSCTVAPALLEAGKVVTRWGEGCTIIDVMMQRHNSAPPSTHTASGTTHSLKGKKVFSEECMQFLSKKKTNQTKALIVRIQNNLKPE